MNEDLNSMEHLVNNEINGNLSRAHIQAKLYDTQEIRQGFMDIAGYSFKKATLTAEFLKTKTGYQAACDAD